MTPQTEIPDIVVASREEASRLLRAECSTFKHVLSIGSLGESLPSGYLQSKADKLRLEFDDIDPGDKFFSAYEYGEERAAQPEDIAKLLRWCRRVRGRTLIHCMAGISRSSASACVLVAIKMGRGKEIEAINYVRSIKPDIWPNAHVLRLADAALERDGALCAAYDAIFEDEYPFAKRALL